MVQTAAALYFSSITGNVKGSKNSSKPVILFITVCSAMNRFLQTNPDMIFAIFITAIIRIHIQSHLGIFITGNSLTKAADTNIKSAIVSSLDPNVLTEFVFLAIVPSTISVSPQRRYIT